MSGPLDGVKVLDLSRFIAGPLCGQILGDMGAEVIKVERPGGEDARLHEPFVNGESLYVMIYNRNKLGITMRTRHPKAHDLLVQLIKWADVLVENYRPGTLANMGFSYHELLALNPRLVVTSISGFGQTGPYAQRALFDAIGQAMSGLMSLTGPVGQPPMLTGAYIADYVAGFNGAIGTLLALIYRERTGKGQVVDVASVDALFSCLGTQPSAYVALGKEPQRQGSRDLLNAPANVFQAADGYVYMHAGTNPLFPKLCAIMGREELATDSRFSGVVERMENIDAIEAIVSEWTQRLSVAEVERLTAEVGIPCGPVLTVSQVVDLEQIKAREMLLTVDHPVAGPVALPGMAVKLSESPGEVRLPPPSVGQHNEHVYREILGLSEDEFDALVREGVI